MNHTGKFLLLIVALVTSFSVTQAQREGGRRNMDPKESAEKQTAMMKDSLALSEAQAGKIAELNLVYAKKMDEARTGARESSDEDREAMRANMRTTMQTLLTEHKTELKKYLTDEQFTKWETVEANQKAKRGDRKRGKVKKKKMN